ncbi:hypothetical protein CDL12_24362 [Handroanthus impetiginosus]|uniref:Late embryogenesis abundant protein LEA-2 subgroup domain-containing protein n=1 Tax=Handroanthus impetiginosus TaxID=429701 RepID=A0A2G9GDP1_9LAMI|nr:hypothetical protein CDL12_24362 [Handroanthus impetiginosus]
MVDKSQKVLSLSAVVVWLSLTPKNPSFRVLGSHIPSLDSRNHSTHGNVSLPNDSLVFDLEIFNPNKRMGIYYSDIKFGVYRAGDGVVGTNSTPGFYQEHKSTTLLKIAIHGSREFLEAKKGGNTDFIIKVETSVMFRIIKWKTKEHHIAYEEQFNDVKMSLNGTVSAGNYAELQNTSKVEVRS